MFLSEQVLSIRREEVTVLGGAEIQEMRRPVDLVVELFGIGQLHLVLDVGLEAHAHEVVVPGALRRHHEEAEEAIAEEHLNALVVRGQVALRVVALVRVLFAPLEAAGRELVGGERHGAGRERARDYDCLLAVPAQVVRHDLGVDADVLRGQLRELVGLRVHPAEGLHLLEILVLREHVWQLHGLVSAQLWHHHNASDLFDLRVVSRADSVHVAGDLTAQIRNGDELLEDVLGQDVRVACLLDVVRGHVNVIGAQVEIGGRDRSHAPLGLRRECGRLVVARGRGDDLVAVTVHRACRRGRYLMKKIIFFLNCKI